jgi:hypothetical protein
MYNFNGTNLDASDAYFDKSGLCSDGHAENTENWK